MKPLGSPGLVFFQPNTIRLYISAQALRNIWLLRTAYFPCFQLIRNYSFPTIQYTCHSPKNGTGVRFCCAKRSKSEILFPFSQSLSLSVTFALRSSSHAPCSIWNKMTNRSFVLLFAPSALKLLSCLTTYYILLTTYSILPTAYWILLTIFLLLLLPLSPHNNSLTH